MIPTLAARELVKPDGMAVPELGLRDLLRDMGWRLSSGEFWYAVSGIVLVIGVWIALNLAASPTGRAICASIPAWTLFTRPTNRGAA